MERIVIIPRNEDMISFLEREDSIYKNIIYEREIRYRDFVESDLIKTDEGKIYYALNVYKIKKGKKYYAKLKSKKGFTVDEKGKLKIWYGSDILSNPHFLESLKALKIDWFVNEGDYLWKFITKTLFEKIITGKITNPIDYLRAYLKLSKINASPKLLYEVCRSHKEFNKISFLQMAYVAKDVDHYLEWLLQNRNESSARQIMFDTANQARILDRKIDFKWSYKRLNEEHTKWTQDIMQEEISSIPDSKVSVNNYDIVSAYVPDFFDPLDTQKKVFSEGTIMKHCVYTNYWRSIEDGRYLVYHIKLGGEEATLGLSVNKEKNSLDFSQLYGKRNSMVSAELRDIVLSFLQSINERINKNKISLISKYELDFI